MKTKLVPIEKIIPYARNPRKNQAVDKVAASIKQFGWRQPIVVDSEMVIIAGHTRYIAAKKIGQVKVPVHVAEGMDQQQIKAYRIMDNRSHQDSDWDDEFLALEIQDLEKKKFNLDLTGLDEVDIASLLSGESGAAGNDGDGSQEVEFSEELLECNNYVVLVFRNEIDWLNAKTHFNLGSKYSKRSNGKPWAKGIGRVIDGGEYLSKVSGKDL